MLAAPPPSRPITDYDAAGDLIKLTRRPVFYTRSAWPGRQSFYDAQVSLYAHRCEKETGPVWPRPMITPHPAGAFIRQFSIDECAIYQCAVGDMSLVGPRPERPSLSNNSSKHPRYMDRHAKRPPDGWRSQRPARRHSIIERTKYDLWYIENWSWR